ncbi:MAG TPA: hypothetical protein VFS59_00600, partial [Gemmatimonadaceae bacterium]|nr:hypothetical protein [Gemmatimonadaceae bacterium]
MPTPSEQKALAFVAMIVLLGGVVRVVRAGAPAAPSVGEQQALARQATAAESAAAAARSSTRGGRTPRPRRGRAEPVTTGSGSGRPGGGVAPSVPQGIGGFPPAGPRTDVDYRTNRPMNGSAVT